MRRVSCKLAVAGCCLLLALPVRAAPVDYCGYGKATTVLLVDRTTRFDKTDQAVFLDAVTGLLARLGAGDRLVGFTMGGDYTQSRKVFDDCKPGCPDDGFFAGLLSACTPVVARARYRQFQTALARVLAELLREPEATPASDLFRTVAEDTRASSLGGDVPPLRQLVIFSDLLENSSFLPERDLRRLPLAELTRRLSEAGPRASVEGATVRVFGFGRDDAPGRPALPPAQRRVIQMLWEDWFREGGARDTLIGFR